MPAYTPNEVKLLEVLNDGLDHTKDELRLAIGDEHTSDGSVKVAVHNLRKKLLPIGHDVVCIFRNRRGVYRQVRLINRG